MCNPSISMTPRMIAHLVVVSDVGAGISASSIRPELLAEGSLAVYPRPEKSGFISGIDS